AVAAAAVGPRAFCVPSRARGRAAPRRRRGPPGWDADHSRPRPRSRGPDGPAAGHGLRPRTRGAGSGAARGRAHRPAPLPLTILVRALLVPHTFSRGLCWSPTPFHAGFAAD